MNARFLALVLVALTSMDAAAAVAESIVVTQDFPIAVDGTIRRESDSDPFTVDTTDTRVRLSRPVTGVLRREFGVFEFDIQNLPPDAIVTGANLILEIAGIQGPAVQAADFHGYFGDGAVTIADAAMPENLVAQFVGQGVGSKIIPVDPAFVAAARQAGNYAGFLGEFTTPSPQYYVIRFFSSESAFSYHHPVLEVIYEIPEPTALESALAGVLIVSVGLAFKRRRTVAIVAHEP